MTMFQALKIETNRSPKEQLAALGHGWCSSKWFDARQEDFFIWEPQSGLGLCFRCPCWLLHEPRGQSRFPSQGGRIDSCWPVLWCIEVCSWKPEGLRIDRKKKGFLNATRRWRFQQSLGHHCDLDPLLCTMLLSFLFSLVIQWFFVLQICGSLF